MALKSQQTAPCTFGFCPICTSVEVFGNDPAVFFDRFCDLVNSITEEAWKGPEEGDCDNESLEVTPYSGIFFLFVFLAKSELLT